jgi:hypothetical protein
VSPVDLLVDVDVAVRRGSSVTRVRARHILRGRTVTLVTADGEVRRRTVDVREWRSELASACRVVAPDPAPTPPPTGLELPWDLVVGTGAALTAHRQDLYGELLARADDSVRDELGRLHRAALGRLRAVGTAPGRRRIGCVAWVLYADGWRAFTPYLGADMTGSRAMVRLERRRPEDLAHEVARWAAGVAR